MHSIDVLACSENNVVTALAHTLQAADAPERLEIVLADGQSTDNPREVVEDLKREISSSGATLKIISCERGGVARLRFK